MPQRSCSSGSNSLFTGRLARTKEQLWTAVRKGLRPERLPRFDTDCWELLTACWHGDPIQRPLVGDITMRLNLIMKRIGRKPLKWQYYCVPCCYRDSYTILYSVRVFVLTKLSSVHFNRVLFVYWPKLIVFSYNYNCSTVYCNIIRWHSYLQDMQIIYYDS